VFEFFHGNKWRAVFVNSIVAEMRGWGTHDNAGMMRHDADRCNHWDHAAVPEMAASTVRWARRAHAERRIVLAAFGREWLIRAHANEEITLRPSQCQRDAGFRVGTSVKRPPAS